MRLTKVIMFVLLLCGNLLENEMLWAAGKHPCHDLIGAAKGFRVQVHIANKAYGLQNEQFKRRVESVCSEESLPVSRDPIGESDRRPILLVHINAIAIENGSGDEIGFACSTAVTFKQHLDGRFSDCMVGTYSRPIVFVGGNGDLEMAQYNYGAVKLLVQDFAKVWRECHKE